MMSPEGDHHMFSHLLTSSHPGLEDMVGQHGHGKMPPSYEQSLQSLHHTQSMATGLHNPQESHFFNSQQQQQQQAHLRQQSIPASMTYNPHLSPIMSPPQSVQSSNSLSPQGNVTSPHQQMMQHQTSPVKPRGMNLPTSPTHFAAMRGASHQRLQSFDFPDSQQHPGMMQQNMYAFMPTPPQTGDTGNPTNFMTPSPDSPGQWSSGSPQSEWSEGIHSPPGNLYPNMKQHNQQEQSAVFI